VTTKKRAGKPSGKPATRTAEKTSGQRPAPRTLGPIRDLERHLPNDWWRTLFNAVYLKTDGDVVEDNQNTVRDVDLLVSATGITPDDHVLDLCCGQGRHAMELASRGFSHVSGVDRSRYLVRLAKKRSNDRGLRVSFHEGDARRFRIPQTKYDCVAVMGNSFGYFELERDDNAVLSRIRQSLKPGGVVALDLVDGAWLAANFEPRSWEWIDEDQFVCRERALAQDGQRLVCREVVTHAERGVIADQFYAERLFSFPAIERMLSEAGFIEVRNHGVVLSQSDRDQDLGMMGRRIFITARAPMMPAKARGKRRTERVAVLLGDPSLPDMVKLDGCFNENDHNTVRRLKDALEAIPGFEFEYLDNHAVMFEKLRAAPPTLVFNLCDEGFGNSALRELHVPAGLEMLGIPFTGAGPGCLAVCYDKSMVRAVAMTLEIPTPLETYFAPEDLSATMPSVFPSILKPNLGDGSLGITAGAVVNNTEELLDALHRLRTELPGRPMLVQEFLTGPEYTIGLIGNPGMGMHTMPVLEVDYSGLDPNLPPILGHESKWDPESPYWTDIKYKRAEISDELQRMLADYAATLFERLGCRDYARIDFRCDSEGLPRLLEVNPNPGWCWDGKLNMIAEFEGMSYSEMLRMILMAAIDRRELAVDRTGSSHPDRAAPGLRASSISNQVRAPVKP
jgi:D-alanine-D-alanine ligase